MFRYCWYWKRWSRILSTNHPDGPIVEVDLTPIPNSMQTWKDIWDVNIRAHGTTDDRDLIMEDLPWDIFKDMEANLGSKTTKMLLTEDFLSQIDWDLYRKHNNGGTSFSLCKNNNGVS